MTSGAEAAPLQTMPAPDSTIEEVRTSGLRYIRMYEEWQFTLGDLAAEIAVMAPAYDHAMGGVEDPYTRLTIASSSIASAKARRTRTSFSGFLLLTLENSNSSRIWSIAR